MRTIDGTTRVCGLIGNPVAHSISPLIHNRLAEIRNDNLVYTTFCVASDSVSEAVKGAYALDILGLNVTVPHKQAVMAALAETDPLAEAIGAVNTLVCTDGGYKGYNTDILGLDRELTDAGISLCGRTVVLLGAGGAARAIAFLCAKRGAAKIIILNRTVERAQGIAEAVNNYFNSDTACAKPLDDCGKLDESGYIVIQTTSVGLHPHDDEAPVTDEGFYARAEVGVDIIYNPAETRFMKLMRQQGKQAFNGLKMLLYQGVAAYELWNGCEISADEAQLVYEDMKRALGIVDE